MSETTVIRELDDYGAKKGGSACLVKCGDDFFVLSSVLSAPDHGGLETLAFPSDADGEVTDWTDVAGGVGKSREDTIAELTEKGPDPESGGRGLFGDTKKFDDRDPGEKLEGLITAMSVIKDGSP